MGQFVYTNGDYNIKATGDLNNPDAGGIITLDTGPNVGQVVVTGNLTVNGSTTTVSAQNLDVRDNIITLNVDEVGPGVTLLYSGIEVDRGNTTGVTPAGNASLVYEESTDTWLFAHGTSPGPFNYSVSKIKVKEILTDPNTDNGDLILIKTGDGVVKVGDAHNYFLRVTDNNDIPNKEYVDWAIQNQPTFQLLSDPPAYDPISGNPAVPNSASRVIVTDKDVDGSLQYIIENTGVSTYNESAVSVFVDGALNSQFFDNRTVVFDLELNSNEITTRDSLTNLNIVVRTQGTGKLNTNYALQLDRLVTAPAPVANTTVVYSSSPSIGDSGLFTTNSERGSGELVSKKRALLFSMIF